VGVRSRVVAELVALFAPPGCAACRTPLGDARDVVCADCRRALPWLRGARCGRCGLPAPCAPCPATRAAFGCAWAPLAYAGPARALVVALKFDGALALADLMAAQMVAAPLLGPGRVLVPVPAHPVRARQRGFDQAARLAAALSHRTGLPLDACLSRTGAADRQLGATRRRRLGTGRIEIAATGSVPEHPVLVDDVHTTGATLHAAAAALGTAGARGVGAVTYARTLRP
jgi:predicted amidophosphoribosyltransferase